MNILQSHPTLHFTKRVYKMILTILIYKMILTILKRKFVMQVLGFEPQLYLFILKK